MKGTGLCLGWELHRGCNACYREKQTHSKLQLAWIELIIYFNWFIAIYGALNGHLLFLGHGTFFFDWILQLNQKSIWSIGQNCSKWQRARILIKRVTIIFYGGLDYSLDSLMDTQQQNGQREWKHRHILNVARDLLFPASLPIKFWGECVSTAAHLINLTPTPILSSNSRYEVICRKSLSYSDLRVFESLFYAHIQPWTKDKSSERSHKCICGVSVW